ncbi:MAG: tetratricopeptide repeat protein [Desulfovermiculus sp.]|nr:tetratricopeptide repeat protein [Desulfovermiculus sp.]
MSMWKSGLGILLLFLLFVLSGCVKEVPPPEETANDHFNTGMAHYQDGDYDAALSEYRQAVDKAPSYLDALYYSGKCYVKKKMPDKAEEKYLECIELDNRYLAAYEDLGLLYFELDRFKDAKKQLETARSLDSVMPEVYTTLGTIYRMEEEFDRAKIAYEQALDINSEYLPAHEGLRLTKIQDDKYVDPQKSSPKEKDTEKGKATKKEKFTGGAKAIDPDDF